MIAAALVIAGCGTSGSSSGSASSVTVSGNTLHIYLSIPAALSSDPAAQDLVHAEELAFFAHHGEVKDFKLALLPLQSNKVSDSARTAIQDTDAIAYLGELAPGHSDQTVGITNAVDLLQISPTDTALELSQATPVVKGSPQTYFEAWGTYGRTFVRMVPTSAQEAGALVSKMVALKLHSVYVQHDSSDYGRALALEVAEVAAHAGLTLTTHRAAADAIFYGTDSPKLAAGYFTAAAASDPRAKLFGSSALNSGLFKPRLSAALIKNLYVTVPGFMPGALSPAGRAFQSAFTARYHHAPNVEAIFGYEAMSQLLAVLREAGKSANVRGTVVKDFLRSSRSGSVLGSYRIDSAGDTSLTAFVIEQLRGGRLVPVSAAPTAG